MPDTPTPEATARHDPDDVRREATELLAEWRRWREAGADPEEVEDE